MKIGINKKVLTIVLAVIAALTFGVFGVHAVSADEGTVSTDAYFTVYDNGTDGGTSAATLDGNNLVVALGEKQTAEFKRDLVLNAFEISFAFDKKIDFVLVYDSFDVNGHPFIEDEKTVYKTEIETVVSIDGTKVSVNGAESVTVPVENNRYTVSADIQNDADGYTFTLNVNDVSFDLSSSDVYKPDMFGGNAVGKFKFVTQEGVSGSVSVDYITQDNTPDSDKKQDFVLVDGKVQDAKSVVLLNRNFYNSDKNEPIKKRVYTDLTITQTEYAIDGTRSSSDFIITLPEGESNIAFNNASSKTLRVLDTAEATFNIAVKGAEGEEDEIYGTFTVEGVADENPPVTAGTVSAIMAYQKALYEATRDGDYYIRLGSGNYLELPSMASLVKDEVTAYDDLKYTVYYRTRTTDWATTTSFKIPVESAGEYMFYVLFKDADGETMEKDAVVNDDGDIVDGIPVFEAKENPVADGITAEGANYVFRFEVYDDAPITVKEAKGGQEKAYKGIPYTAAAFVIEARAYTEEYTLSYSTTENGEYTEILPASELDEEERPDEYKANSKYAYDGKLSFTPAETGYYKITLTVYGDSSTKKEEASTIINALSTPTRVVPNEDNWFLNNIWSLVFLSIGTLALIGIIVILCIKPKDAGTEPAEGKKSNTKKQK